MDGMGKFAMMARPKGGCNKYQRKEKWLLALTMHFVLYNLQFVSNMSRGDYSVLKEVNRRHDRILCKYFESRGADWGL